MTSSSRRISQNELQNIKQIQKHLEKQNMKLTQIQLTDLMTNFVIDHLDEFFKSLKQKNYTSNEDPLIEWLNSPVSGKIKTNSVDEHDVIN